jgi:hypothetical protein
MTPLQRGVPVKAGGTTLPNLQPQPGVGGQLAEQHNRDSLAVPAAMDDRRPEQAAISPLADGVPQELTAFIVERSLELLSEAHRVAFQHALSEACRRLTASGSPVRYLGSTLVPARSRCFCLFEAASIGVIRAVNEAALVPYTNIEVAIDLPATHDAT